MDNILEAEITGLALLGFKKVDPTRIGIVKVSKIAVDNGYVAALFASIKATVVHVDSHYYNNNIEYTICSDILDENPEGQILPHYVLNAEVRKTDGRMQLNISADKVSL